MRSFVASLVLAGGVSVLGIPTTGCHLDREGLWSRAERDSGVPDGGGADAGATDAGAPSSDAAPTGGCGTPEACTPMEDDTQTEECGSCGRRTRRRVCSADCAWGEWSDWTACAGEGACRPGAGDTTTDSCGPCDNGERTITRTCSDSCEWEVTDRGECEDRAFCRQTDGSSVCPGDSFTIECPLGSFTCVCGADGEPESCRGSCASVE